MAKRKKTYEAVQSVTVAGQAHAPGDVFDAYPKEVAFLVQVGAAKETQKEKKD